MPSVKVVAYLDPLDEHNGALRVLPGSHRLDERVLTDLLHGPAFRDEARAREATWPVPAHVVTSQPGDVIVFDERLWHASVGGRNRLQWSTCYVLDPATVEEEQAVCSYLASQFVAALRLDYDPRHYPYYGDPFRSTCPPRWSEQLERLGALAAAEAEQRQISSQASSMITAGAVPANAWRAAPRVDSQVLCAHGHEVPQATRGLT